MSAAQSGWNKVTGPASTLAIIPIGGAPPLPGAFTRTPPPRQGVSHLSLFFGRRCTGRMFPDSSRCISSGATGLSGTMFSHAFRPWLGRQHRHFQWAARAARSWAAVALSEDHAYYAIPKITCTATPLKPPAPLRHGAATLVLCMPLWRRHAIIACGLLLHAH